MSMASTPEKPVDTYQISRETVRARVLEWLLWLVVGALLVALAYQVPVQHVVHVGLNDASYVQNFNDPTNRWGVIDPKSQADTPLRWSRDYSDLIFPQVGLPATATIRWRAVRPAGSPLPTVRVLLNGTDDLGTFRATGEWETHSFTITGGLAKPNDLFLELRTDPVVQTAGELEGVQVDLATLSTTGWPIVPYPSQLLYGGLAVAFGAMLVRRRRWQMALALLVALSFLLLYRLPVTGYPLRALPPFLALALGLALFLRSLPDLLAWLQARPRLARALALGGAAVIVLGWLWWVLQAAQLHTVLSLPGVERDFSAFAPRAASLVCPQLPAANLLQAGCVLRADDFYQFGYPFLLWLAGPLTGGSAFDAGHLVAALCGALLLAAVGALGWRLLGVSGALLSMLTLALSPLVSQYSLYLGTDMPFAALWTLALAALIVPRRLEGWAVVPAGLLSGLAFDVRHPGLLLLPLGWLALILLREAPPNPTIGDDRLRRWLERVPWRQCAIFTLGWLAAVLPQLAVNIVDTGNPLYNRQAKNIWLAVYGNTDFSRAGEASDDVSLASVVLADPARFTLNWWHNLQVFAGTGAEDTGEFGQGIALRLLYFPANWLALIGLGIWLVRGSMRERFLLAASVIYLLALSVGFLLPRFFLPLAPVMAMVAATTVLHTAHRLSNLRLRMADSKAVEHNSLAASRYYQWTTLAAIVLFVLMLSGPQIGARYVYDHQDRDAASVVRTLLPRLATGGQVLFALPPGDLLPKYSAIARYAAAAGVPAQYVVWSPQVGNLPSIVGNRSPLATFGRYQVYGTNP